MKKTIIGFSILFFIFLTGCAKPEPSVKDYSNSLAKTQKEREFFFRENSQECKLYSHYMASGRSPSPTYTVPYPQQSGSFTLRDTTTGDRYSGTYRSTENFSTGFANGAALGSAIKRSQREDEYRELAFDYCMTKYGWRKIDNQ